MPGADENKEGNPGGSEDQNKGQNQNPGGSGAGGSGSEDDGIGSLEDAKKIIKDLRAENAKNRTKGKSQEDQLKTLGDQLGAIKKHLNIQDDVDPAEKLKVMATENEDLQFELSITQLARIHNIPLEQDKYFRFLVGERLAALQESGKEGEELSEEAIAEVIEEVNKVAGQKQDKPNGNRTGVDEKGGKKPVGGGSDAMTPEQFAKLSISEKSKMYLDNRTEYDRLLQAAKDKRLL